MFGIRIRALFQRGSAAKAGILRVGNVIAVDGVPQDILANTVPTPRMVAETAGDPDELGDGAP